MYSVQKYAKLMHDMLWTVSS